MEQKANTWYTSIPEFCSRQRELLVAELESENQPIEEGRSHVLNSLIVDEVSVGLYGRTVVRLTSENEPLLPAHRFTTGDEVEIRSKSDSSKTHPAGVISEVTDASVSIALFTRKVKKSNQSNDGDENDESAVVGSPPLSLIARSSIEVHQKLLAALSELERTETDHKIAGRVIQSLFEPIDSSTETSQLVQPFNSKLDDSQLEAISFALDPSRPVTLLHGPPGSGKTTTVVELIQQAVRQNHWKVLVTAPSNVAVDNILSRLVAQKEKTTHRKRSSKLRVVRLGHPARLQSDILPYSLEALVQAAEGTEIVADVRKELQSFLRILNNPRSRGSDKRTASREMKTLRKEIRMREEKVVAELMDNAQVVLSTCVGAANQLLRDMKFDLVIIDEAAQSLEAACWIPALRGPKLVLAGDHCQLPPTIKCNRSDIQRELGRTMFERLMELYGDDKSPGRQGRVSRMLKVQYRMHENIANWASLALYGGELQTHESVRLRTIRQLTGLDDEEGIIGESPLLLIDTAGCAMHESVNPAGSRYNEDEAQLVAHHVQKLLNLQVQQDQIAIITPYNGQVEILRARLLPEFPKLEIRSVDGFQGGEREAVVLSLVRSSARGGIDGIGFLRDDRRLNVAVTRAKRHCCVICDSETVSQSPFLNGLLKWIQEYGEERSALEFIRGKSEVQQIVNGPVDSAFTKHSSKTDLRKSLTPLQEVRSKSQDSDQHLQELEVKVKNFVTSGKPGDTMVLSTELSRHHRRAIHELAEKLCISHLSEGMEGVDRRITLSIPNAVATSDIEGNEALALSQMLVESLHPSSRHSVNLETGEEEECAPNNAETDMTRIIPFAVLQNDDDDDDDGDENSKEDKVVHTVEVEKEDPTMNCTLGSLAKERRARERASEKCAPSPASSSVVSSKKKKKTGQKLGGTVIPKVQTLDNQLDGLDDMAFLDAQIEKVQNSHGRKIEGKGSNYRTIMNGILITKGKPQEKKKDPKASAALQSKLKDAQNSRKPKVKKK